MLGWIKMHRSLLNWEWFSSPNALSVFMYLLLSVKHKDSKWRGIDVLSGQCIVSLNKIAADTGLTLQKVRTTLKKLESTGEIIRHATNKYSVITIVNWNLYQDNIVNDTNQITHNQQTNSTPQITSNQQANNTSQVTSNQQANNTPQVTSNQQTNNTPQVTSNQQANNVPHQQADNKQSTSR